MTNPIAKNIKAYREARSWTQAMLAYRSGVSERGVQRAESGVPISSETLLSFAEALEVSPEDLRRDQDAEELERLRQRFEVVPLEDLASPAVFLRLADGCMASMFQIESDPSPDVHELIAEAQQVIQDYLDIDSELTPAERLSTARALLTNTLAPLRGLGWVLSAGSSITRVKAAPGGEPFQWRVLFLVASPAGETRQQAIWDKSLPIQFG